MSPYLAHSRAPASRPSAATTIAPTAAGIGESCYHHPSKTLTKAELAAIENAGLSVYVVFQHCGAQCVNFDLQNKETADKGRKDAEGAVAVGARSRPARRHADLFRHRLRSRTRQRLPLPADRIWPSIDAYFDQVNEVLAHTHWQVGVYGAGITCRRLKASGKAKYFWLSTSLGHFGSREFFNSGHWHLFQNVTEIKRSYAREHHRHRRHQSGGALFRPVDDARPAPAHDAIAAIDILACRAFVKKRLRHRSPVQRQPQARATRRSTAQSSMRRAAS